MKKLYKVHITYETVILEESQEMAEKAAAYIIRHESDDEPAIVVAEEITKPEDLPDGWNPQCYPWGNGDTGTRTIGEIISNNVPVSPPMVVGKLRGDACKECAGRGKWTEHKCGTKDKFDGQEVIAVDWKCMVCNGTGFVSNKANEEKA